MKKYKIKEEAKKYFPNKMHEFVLTLEDWDNYNVTSEALEEVEDKIKLFFVPNDFYLAKSNDKEWTNQEREDIEKFLNVFGSWDKMREFIFDYYTDGKNELDFEKLLKEKGYDK